MATACNKEIEVKYDYNVNDYVQLGKYEDIAVTVDKTSIILLIQKSAEVLLMGIRYWLLMLLQVRVHSQQGCLIQMVLQ